MHLFYDSLVPLKSVTYISMNSTNLNSNCFRKKRNISTKNEGFRICNALSVFNISFLWYHHFHAQRTSSFSVETSFLQCLSNHSPPSNPISGAIYTSNSANFSSVLNSYVRNLRFNFHSHNPKATADCSGQELLPRSSHCCLCQKCRLGNQNKKWWSWLWGPLLCFQQALYCSWHV